MHNRAPAPYDVHGTRLDWGLTMEPDQADPGQSKNAKPKRPYRRPEIRRLGTVRELT